ncbi:hypothetical protein CVD28_02135 [Bacillus sp. M6-12]|uniref:hypothetical protein n=1 Tax=Bacillus sp. M6-12 TaxID=2054166 RepID=UPI000C7687DA|nr:hypothetical protein [Bacillus sp. M6-12]PLS19231.1 hypothetical protein CVD28_02135 [Bacillus sp. M6-12]
MKPEYISQFEAFIHEHFLDALKVSPVNSTTPFEVGDSRNGERQFIFVSKCSPFMYEPVKGRSMKERTSVEFTMYNEGKNLILRFEVLDMILETEILSHQAHRFLSTLIHQDKITLVIIDANQYDIVWMTNTIPFRTIRFHYKEIFEMYNVI